MIFWGDVFFVFSYRGDDSLFVYFFGFRGRRRFGFRGKFEVCFVLALSRVGLKDVYVFVVVGMFRLWITAMIGLFRVSLYVLRVVL